MSNSVFDRIFPSSSPLLPQHERRSPPISPPMATSLRTHSSLSSSRQGVSSVKPALQPVPLSATVVSHSDPLLPIDRAARSLQRTIQSLLDAQSEGLLSSLASGPQDDLSSNGSLTPTLSTTIPKSVSGGGRVVPVRQPPEKKITLRGGRRGLLRSMRDFALLKQEEIKVLDEQVREREGALSSVKEFEEKRTGLEAEIAGVRNDENSRNAESLKSDAEKLDAEIQELETRLLEMKARHRLLLDEANQVESSVQSKLSSYNATLALVDSDIKKFLTRPPIASSLSSTTPNTNEEGFYALIPKRRTLDMAKGHWQDETNTLQSKKEEVQKEMSALEQGGVLWRDTVDEITHFEARLKKQTQNMSASQHGRNEDMRTVLGQMDAIMESLEHRFQLARTNSWNLLVCCIGAELGAFREGRALLVQTLGLLNDTNLDGDEEYDYDAPGEELMPYTDDASATAATVAGMDAAANGSNESLNTTLLQLNATSTSGTKQHQQRLSEGPPRKPRALESTLEREDDDDDPSRDFLISHT